MDLIYGDECYAIMGGCFAVYKDKGHGFVEPVYQECLEMELGDLRIPFLAHPPLVLEYKGRPLKAKYTPDFICYEKIIVEIKAATVLIDEHRAQVQNYLRASGFKLGLLVNFGHHPKVEWERIVL